MAESEDIDTALAEARMWARHGYEIGQRSCTWSDHGVAPAWLTEGHDPAALDPSAELRMRADIDMQNVRLKQAMRDVRRILADLGVTNPPPRLAAALAELGSSSPEED